MIPFCFEAHPSARMRVVPVFSIILMFCTGAYAENLNSDALFSVEMSGCLPLDKAEVERFLELELSTDLVQGEDAPLPHISVSCFPQRITVVIVDVTGALKIERTVPAPDGEGAERQVAIAVAQFVAALWRSPEWEESVKKSQRKTPPPPLPAESNSSVEAPSQEESEEETDEEDRAPLSLRLGGSARFRSLELADPYGVGRVQLGMGGWVSRRIGVFGLVAYEGGRIQRDSGEVGLHAVVLGLKAAWRMFVVDRRFLVDAELAFSGGYVRLEGNPVNENFSGGKTGGGLAQVGAGFCPTLVLGRLLFAVLLEGGYAFDTVTAAVRDEADVSIGGWWVGVGVRLGLRIL